MPNSNAGIHADEVVRVATGHETAATQTLQLIDSSWRRCLLDYKLDPAQSHVPTVLDERILKDIQAHDDELVEIARAEMDSLYDQISGSGYALLLANTAGVILCERVDPTLQRLFDGAGLIVGADWSERCEGTNGIGTCVAESRPITIHQTDHFRSKHIALTCSAAPIHDSAGRLIAVLDASSVGSQSARGTQMHTMALVNSSARLIEKCFFLRRHEADVVVRFHYRPEFVDLLHDGALVVSADGHIVAADATSLKLLDMQRSEMVGRPLAEIFDAHVDELLTPGVSNRRAIWEIRDNRKGRRFYAGIAASSRGIARAAAPARVRVSPQASGQTLTLDDLAGDDEQLRRCVHHARRVADRDVAVILHGPTGSGKEAFARAMHLSGSRAAHPFVAVNCGSIPETLIESELFGYSAGAFTGARKEGMRGRIAQSSGGTLFLDEIGDMPLALQTRLLRVLEEREVVPLGASRPLKVDLRILSASHRNLREHIERGTFREDLYYRLNGITLELPALARRTDKERVIRDCIARETANAPDASIDSDAFELLLNYAWPGNIRQLRNVIRAALAIGNEGRLRLADLPDEICEGIPVPPVPAANSSATGGSLLMTAERTALLETIRENQGNMSHVAAQLQISRNTLYRKLRKHAITAHRDRYQ
jgi:sigma-54 dependent transcriptional regulator, acetoin dehydrogenase operon transcriptional activator AcoR